MAGALQYEDPSAPRGGNNTQFIMELINGFSLLMAVALVGVSGWGLWAWDDSPEGSWVNAPSWVFWCAIIFGVFVMFVSILGCLGARKRNKCVLLVYIVIVFTGCVALVAISAYSLIYHGYLSEAKEQKEWDVVDSNVQKYIIDGFTEFAKSQPEKWIELQDYNHCCGYNAAETYAIDCKEGEMEAVVSTGGACHDLTKEPNGDGFCAAIGIATSSGNANALQAAYELAEDGLGTKFEFCQVKLLEATETYSQALGITACFMVVATFIAFVSACRLACCVSSKDGGYAEEFGYGYGGQQQQTTGGAISGTAGVNYA